MKSLSVQELEDKLKQATEDTLKMPTERGREVLMSYIEYLQYEIAEAKKHEGQ
jgi:hypothetical protein